jgi:hypothetical protein
MFSGEFSWVPSIDVVFFFDGVIFCGHPLPGPLGGTRYRVEWLEWDMWLSEWAVHYSYVYYSIVFEVHCSL